LYGTRAQHAFSLNCTPIQGKSVLAGVCWWLVDEWWFIMGTSHLVVWRKFHFCVLLYV
jgi:hypothetical protein